VTSAVHYVRFPFTQADMAAFVAGPATLIVNHPEYPEGKPGAVLSDATRTVLTEDLTTG
jgi:hypothetical protein